MSFKKIFASMLAVVAACGMSAAAITLDSAEVANDAVVAEEATLAAESIVAYTAADGIWGECRGPANESFVLKVYSNDTLMGTTTLNNIGGIIDGDVNVTWGLRTVGTDEYWTYAWEKGHPKLDCPPTKVELWIDGALYSEGPARLNGPDDLNPIKWSDVKGVFNPHINGVYLGGNYNKAYLCLELYNFYLDKTFVAKYYSNDELVADVALVEGKLLSGAKDVIGCCLGFDGDFDEYWDTTWYTTPNTSNMPDFVEVYIDGVKVAEKAGPFGNGIKGWDPASNGNWLYELIAEDYMNINGVSGVASIGTTQFVTLQAAFDAVKDGDIITVLGDATVNRDAGCSISSGYYEGAAYLGDQSFTIDLGGNTITADNTINDYFLYFRNDGAKSNEITIKNGTIDAGNSAYSAVCTGYTNVQEATINLENVTLIGNRTNGAVFKPRGSKTFANVKAGTVIIGKDNYACIESTAKLLNIYDGVELYQNGTTSYLGALIGVSGNGVANVYGGKGVSANSGIIAMSSGGTINVYGGEWKAMSNNASQGVLSAQNDKGTYANGGDSVINISDGKFDGYISAWTHGRTEEVAELNISGGTFSVDPTSYCETGYKALPYADGGYKVVAENQIVNEVSVIFTEDTAARTEETATYNIVIKASGDGIINRLNTADLVFGIDSDKVAYEITGANGITVTNEAGTERFMFNFDGKPEGIADTANEIVIGQVKFTGYDEFSFGVVDAETNLVTATTLMDNIVDYFDPDGKLEDGTEVGKLVINNGLTDEIIVPTRLLTINVAFPNEVVENTPAEQQMTVTVYGGDLAEAIVVDLGNKTFTGATGTDDTVVYDGSYKIVLANELTKNITYNVTVEGAGYRTARYTVTMTDAKTLNFWNNVKDNKVEVEDGKASSATEKNFLAGDIVGDNQINIYDLSAVVSYFATETSADYAKYVKYDLNRDGKIDSKDVAYILVSWGN